MGLEHRRTILEAALEVSPTPRVLVWGVGGSELWMADQLPAGSSLLAVEHNRAWATRVRAVMPAHASVLHVQPTGKVGPTSTIGEEDARHLAAYVSEPAAFGPFDVILVDGLARGACLDAAASMLTPGGVCFLHDAQRDWYAKALERWQTRALIGECADYPGPALWMGVPAESPVGV